MVPAFFRVSLKRFLWLLFAYGLCRLLFLLWNWPTYQADSLGEVAHAFILGARFDTSAILFTNAFLFLLWMLPTRWLNNPVSRLIDTALFGLINFFFIGFNFIDTEFVNFAGKRTSYDLLFLHSDVERQSVSILLTYWHLFAMLALLTGMLLWFYPRFPKAAPREGRLMGLLWRTAALFLIITGMRGGYQFKPLSPVNAYFNSKHELGLLTLNTAFNMIKTRPSANVEHTRYFGDDREANRILHKLTEPSRPALGLAKSWNVVVLIVESLSTEYTGASGNLLSYTPFLDQLAKKSFSFRSSFANARRSIEGVPAVICGLPTMMEEPIITSDFANDRMDCLPKILGPLGYSSYFLHGTHNGSMHFDTFSHLAGFEHFVGLDEYPKDRPQDLDQYWGVLDEPMLQYAADVIDKAAKPVFLSVFTLSSHHPYYIPPQYKGKFPAGPLEIHESMGYADYSLEQFFKTAESKPWFKNTIFVITGDHTQKSDPNHAEYRTVFGNYRVPVMFYVPGLTGEQVGYDPARITQHIDILPSILDLLGVNRSERLLVGQSVFDRGLEGKAYNFTSYSYWYIDSKVAVDFPRGTEPLRTYTHTNTFDRIETKAADPKFDEALTNLKAVIHYFNVGLVRNNLYQWRDSL